MTKLEVFQSPFENKWFVCFDGLMDTDLGYFRTEQAAMAAGKKELDKRQPAKRYQVRQPANKLPMVVDSWTNSSMGIYPTKAKAQARARLLNSRAS